MTEKTVKIFPNMYFGLTHCYDEVPDNNDFKLHNHDDVYEIVLFLSGDSEFYAEGNVYKLKPFRSKYIFIISDNAKIINVLTNILDENMIKLL